MLNLYKQHFVCPLLPLHPELPFPEKVLELPNVQMSFKEAEEPDQIANIRWIMEKASEFHKNI